MMTQTQKAARLGVSANYLSQIYHGKRKPGIKTIQEWEQIIGKDFNWWQTANTSQVQKVLDAIGE